MNGFSKGDRVKYGFSVGEIIDFEKKPWGWCARVYSRGRVNVIPLSDLKKMDA